jgi:phosphatidylinositol glycan class B
VGVFLSWNIPIGLYLSFRHQRGVLDATDFIRTQLTSKDEVLFLMPCHSTPLYR